MATTRKREEERGNASEEDPKYVWFGEKARKVREDLKGNLFCKHCINNCDLINNYTEEFIHFTIFLVTKPRIAFKLYQNIRKGYGSHYIKALENTV
jgi:hypothetical protein